MRRLYGLRDPPRWGPGREGEAGAAAAELRPLGKARPTPPPRRLAGPGAAAARARAWLTAVSCALSAGPPVCVGMNIDIASIDMVSEVNMVSACLPRAQAPAPPRGHAGGLATRLEALAAGPS